jgi:hypothetical protein
MNKNILVVLLVLLMLPLVSATTRFVGDTPTEAQLLHGSTATVSGESTLVALSNLSIRLSLNGRVVQVYENATHNLSTLTATDLTFGSYSALLTARNSTGGTETATRTFTLSACNTSEYALWGVLLLIFIVGLLYFAYDGFINGNAMSVAWLVGVTVATFLVGTFAMTALRGLC